MKKKKRILFKNLNELEQSIVYSYNSGIYIRNIENASLYLEFQKSYEDKIISKYLLKLSVESINKIRLYIKTHRVYNRVESRIL